MMRRRLRILPLLSAGTIFLGSTGLANVTGMDAQNFNPTTSGMDFVTVQSSETLDPGVFNLGLFANYAVNTLPYFSNQGTQNRGKFNDTLLMTDLNLGVGVWRNIEVGVSYPRLVKQTVSGSGSRGQFGATGNTELRFMTKMRLWEKGTQGFAFILSTNINRVKNNPFAGKDPGPTVNTEFAYDKRWGDLTAGVNAGYRFKKPGEAIPGSPVTPSDDDWIASLAASWHWPELDSKLILEVFGSRPATGDSRATDRQRSSLEALAGLKHFVTDELAVHGGAGTELIHGASSPDWRAYAGINWTTDSRLKKERETLVTYQGAQEIRTTEPLQVKEGEVGINFGNIYFKSGSHTDILPGAEANFEKLVQYVNTPPVYKKLVIEGHTDSIGSAASNLTLSQRRAETVRRVLIERYKLDAAKIQAIGYGEDRPIADNGNYQGRQKNRRVYFRVSR